MSFTSGRALTGALATAIAAGSVKPVYFVEGFFASGPLRLWSGVGTITWNGLTWIGAGSLGSISELPETSSLQAQGITLSLSGIPSSIIGKVLTDIRQGEACRVWFGLLDASNAIIADPFRMFSGRIDVGSIDEQAESCTVSITVENMLVNFQRANEHRYTDADQQLYYPGDKGFEFVPSVQQWNGIWGRAGGSTGTNTGGSGGGSSGGGVPKQGGGAKSL